MFFELLYFISFNESDIFLDNLFGAKLYHTRKIVFLNAENKTME